MYVILGATGKTGSIVANSLLDKKKKVRVVGRDNKKLAAFTSRGAEAFTANITDEKALTRAFTGAEAVYAMIPPDLANDNYRGFQSLASNAIAKALENAGVRHAVTLSSFGADKPEKTGPIAGLHEMESKLKLLGLKQLWYGAFWDKNRVVIQVAVDHAITPEVIDKFDRFTHGISGNFRSSSFKAIRYSAAATFHFRS